MGFIVRLELVLPIFEYRVKELHALRSDQADIVDEGGDAPRRETAAREAHEEDLIAGLLVEVCRYKLVGFANMFGQA